jgi:hypothetical protein
MFHDNGDNHAVTTMMTTNFAGPLKLAGLRLRQTTPAGEGRLARRRKSTLILRRRSS